MLDFIDQRLDADEVVAIQQHMDGCHTCRRLVATMARAESMWSSATSDAASLAGDPPSHVGPATRGTLSEEDGEPSNGTRDTSAGRGRRGRRRDSFPTRSVADLLDWYRILDRLGRGGSGLVYRGYDTLLERPVAIKFLAEGQPDEQERHRLLQEARAVARLRHPHVVTIHHVGQDHGKPYIVMELLEGETLRRMAKPLPGEQVLDIGIALCQGLAAAHRRGILHRDVKSSNAIRTAEGEVKLIDFGLAKVGMVPSEPTGGDAARPGPTRVESGAGCAPGDAGRALEALEAAKAPNGDASRRHALHSPLVTPTAKASAAGPIVGTLIYMAPEVYRAAPATTRSDVYSLGVVLYELATGYTPAEDPELAKEGWHPWTDVARARPLEKIPPLCERLPQMAQALGAVIDRCLQSEPAARFASAEEVLTALLRLRPRRPGATVPAGNPYRGLRAFEAEHRDVFFGRDQEIEEVLERLRSEPLVVVTGDSGLGKSSLCRAGVLPRVAEDGLEHRRGLRDDRHWSVVELRPGRHPLGALGAALAPRLAPGQGQGQAQAVDEMELRRRLGDEPEAVAHDLCGRQGHDTGLLLFVDQLEELFTLSEVAEAHAAGLFLGHLVANAGGGLRVLVTVRGDFLTRLAALPGIAAELPRAPYILPPLGDEGLREAVVEPAACMDVRFESKAMVDELVASLKDNAGGLPLLSFALAELWERRDPAKRVIPAAALQELGGVAGALARHGDGVLRRLGPGVQEAARRILLQMVSDEGTRGRRSHRELGATEDQAVAVALEALVSGRLLRAETVAGEEGAVYEVAHEALIERWGTLRAWLDADRGQRALLQQITAATKEWLGRQRSAEVLWVGRRLDEALAVNAQDLGPHERAFVAASRSARRRQRLGQIGLGLGVVLVILLVVGLMRFRNQQARTQAVMARVAQARSGLAKARDQKVEFEKARGEALNAFDRSGGQALRDEAEQKWNQARALAAQVEAKLEAAAQELETALELDPQQRALKELRGELLYEQILLGELQFQKARVRKLHEQLASSDPDGTWRRRLEAPARLALDVVPPGTRVGLERYEGDHGVRRLMPVTGWAGAAASQLPPGSYLLTARAHGRASVRLPLLLGRGETLRVSLELPPAEAVPEGFVYVPPGGSLFGSDDEDEVRKDFGAPPEHRVKTEGYLIGRTEVTLGEYIEFLNSLPPPERKQHMPVGNDSNVSVQLEQLPGDWRFTLRAPRQQLVARFGEPVRYLGRERRAVQDWRQFPVAGVHLEDAAAYLKWLDESGRVPRARLCNEYEWERAARGADGRRFPHGDELAPDDANFDETYGRKYYGPDAVGSHPASASPFGVQDLAGNVWEWVASVQEPSDAVIRGGTWWNARITSRSVNREISQAQVRNPLIGLRVCASLPPAAAAR